MTKAEEVIAFLKESPTGELPPDVLAQKMKVPEGSLSVYLTEARNYLRRVGSSETVAYRDSRGGDPVRLVPNYDPRAKAPVAQQRRQAETRQEEIGAQYQRLGSDLMERGLIAEANIAFAYSGQAQYYKAQLSKLDLQFKQVVEEVATG